MPCPHCGSETVSPLGRCTNCGSAAVETILSESSSRGGPFTGADTPTGFTPAAPAGDHMPGSGPLIPGQPFGSRYHIIRVLGAGGMGVVYHAWDGELGVAVALKVIRPEVLQDAGAAGEIQRRFKRELVLARQVTHRNVVRIHDLGEIEGIKYLTMPFVEGENLATVLKSEGKLPLRQALSIARQVASGLAAAHEVGVVHRDLKPENIMLEADGDALIMDFGISRSVSGTGTATQLGAVLGTLEYMPPEQAQGQPVDHRADIYSFGLVLYDLIAGRQRLAGRDNPMLEVLSRMQAGPPPIRTIDPSVPAPVERILARCLASSPDARYATTAELVADLEALTPDGHLRQPATAGAGGMPRTTVAIGAALMAVVIAAASWWMLANRGPSVPAAAVEPISVLVANFQNQTNDEQFDGLIEQALAIGIEGASFVTAYPRRDALRIGQQIDPGRPLNEDLALLVSRREGIDVIIAGSITHQQGKYNLSLKVLELSKSSPVLEWTTEVTQKEGVLAAVGQGAAKVRNALGDTTADADRPKDAETFTAASLDAAAAYAKGQELTWAGEIEAAIAKYQEAIRLDPEFGRAYAGLAALYYNTGRRDEALEHYQIAMSHTDRMTEREKFRTRGGYYLMVQNSAKASEEFQQLVDRYPADTAGLANLAVARVYERKMSDALALGRRAAAIYPDNVIRRNNVALFAMYAGDFATAEREALEVLEINAEFPKAYVALALSQLAQGRAEEAAATWRRLEQLPAGRTFAVAGLADLALFQGRLAEAAGILEAAAGAGSADARRLVTLAETRLAQGDRTEAASLAARAADLAKDNPPVIFLAGQVLARARQPRAAKLADALRGEIDRERQMYGALLAGEIALAQADARGALDRFREAQELTDTWLGRFGLGRTYLAAGSYPEAESEFDTCLARRGEATAVFLDEVPTYRLLPPVHYYMGLVREGLKNDRGAAESFRTFLDLKKDGDEQGLVADARRRVAAR